MGGGGWPLEGQLCRTDMEKCETNGDFRKERWARHDQS